MVVLKVLAFLIAAAFMAGWVSCLVGFVRMWPSRRWPETTGTAVEIREQSRYRDGRRDILYSPVIEFWTHDGRRIHDLLGDWSTGLILKMGESAQVKYNPAQPEHFRLTGFRGSGAGLAVLMLLFAPAAAAFVLWWFVLRS
ncbi:DUF3592 domain-containing protein [Spirillospora sp. NPDC048824]|uniref:DUF3592 domain-containing protein n=1 Tax=Spirillospora sp. NPDC048824 TaxID=3364526 RepID=UPI00371E3F7E